MGGYEVENSMGGIGMEIYFINEVEIVPYTSFYGWVGRTIYNIYIYNNLLMDIK